MNLPALGCNRGSKDCSRLFPISTSISSTGAQQRSAFERRASSSLFQSLTECLSLCPANDSAQSERSHNENTRFLCWLPRAQNKTLAFFQLYFQLYSLAQPKIKRFIILKEKTLKNFQALLQDLWRAESLVGFRRDRENNRKFFMRIENFKLRICLKKHLIHSV